MKTYRVPLYLLMALITAVSLFAGLFHGIAFFHRRLLNESLHPIVDLLSALVTVTAISLLFLVFRKYHRVIASLKTALAERKHAEEELTRVYGMTKTVIDNMNDAVSLIDVRNFRIVGVNSVFLKEYGQSDESEVLGKPCYEVTHHRRDICSPPDDICPLAETVRTGEHFTAEHVHYGKNGERIYVEVSTSPIKDEHGNVVQVVHVARDITERKRLEEEIRHMAYHDTLTGLPNKRLFKDIVNVELAQASRNRKKLAFMFLDLDRFKEINDTLGHEAGDHLLKEVAARLRKTIRASDTLARIGGDEFNMILSDIAQEEDVTVIVRKILSSFQEPFTVDGHELYITTSIGVSIYPDDSGDVEVLLRYADIAMYHAKEHGRNNYQFYSPSINFRSFERIRLENMLRRAVEHGELEMHYQPQVDIKTRRVVCAEALVRWRHPELGLLKPDHFIPLAEGMGFITAIDEWVLRTVGAQIRSWLDMGLPPVCVSVNLSAKEFLNPALTERISRALAETALPPELLNIEITESVAMGNIEHTVARLNELTRMGIRILIDDFGTGYSSLNYLKRLPVQKLKIDKSFVQDIATDSDDRAIIRAVAAMAHNMNISVLAEGVETEEQLSFLRSARCDEAQGYLFSEPVPADKFVELFHLAKASSC